MTIRHRLTIPVMASALGLFLLAGCDYDRHPDATGTVSRPPETKGVEDPGTVHSGGPVSSTPAPK